jgi:ABC-2 type transport system ATP-binding protein
VTLAIELDGLVKRYGDRAVVDGVSLTVAPGEIVALLGPNGAGKTTSVEIIEGYRHADGGTVRVLGDDPAHGGRALRARVGLMLQGGGIDMRARPLETLHQYARFHADPRDPDALLDLVGLTGVATTRYRRLSGGERQRLGLALALVGRPEVVILDEPTAGMDPEGRAATRRIVADLRDEGTAILLTSHDLADVERLADRIHILVGGRVVAAGTAAELAAGLRPRLRLRLDQPLTEPELEGLRAAAGGGPVTVDGDRYLLAELIPSPEAIAAVAAWAAREGRLIVELRSVGGSLEDAYLDLVGAA